MINFKAVDIEDRDVMSSYFSKVNYRNCDFSFATVFTWAHKYLTSYAIVNDFMVVRFLCDDGLPCYMMPIGDGVLSDVLPIMMADAKERNDRFRIHAITAQMFSYLDASCPKTFVFEESRDFFEYLYVTDDLIYLKGKKYQAKRNHINRFKRENPVYNYAELTIDLIPACLELYNQWASDHIAKYPDADLNDERTSVICAFDHFNELKLQGAVLYAGDKMVAFTFGERITNDTYAIHAEKALHNVHGAFTMINKLFAEHVASDYKYINREEDLGFESLRKAKMSYYPFRFLRRGSVNLITA